MKCKLADIAELNPKESLKKGTVAKKVAMDQLQPFCRDIPGYTLETFKKPFILLTFENYYQKTKNKIQLYQMKLYKYWETLKIRKIFPQLLNFF